jgi:hypothetical protein
MLRRIKVDFSLTESKKMSNRRNASIGAGGSSEKTPLKPSATSATPVSPPWTLLSVLAVLVAVLVFGIITTVNTGSINTAVNAISPTIASIIINTSCAIRGYNERKTRAYQHRLDTAFDNYLQPVECHLSNGDEVLYASTHFASFSKGMQHDALGHVNPASYALFLKAANSGLPSDWNSVPLAPGAVRQFTNPQAGWAYVNEGGDPQSFNQPPAPAFASAEQAGEMVELYWMALLRDVNFANYSTDPLAAQAVASIGLLSDFRGPPVSAATLFRGLAPGCLVGPYISQFLYQPCVFGANTIDMRLVPPTPSVNFMTNYTEYLRIQNGLAPTQSMTYGPTPVYIRNGRDLSHWVHVDVLFQAYFEAMLCLLNMGAPLKSSLPYTMAGGDQMGFGTWGNPFIAQMSTNSAVTALKTVWFQKYGVHRRLRPEVYGARVHNHVTSAYTYPIHADLLGSNVLAKVFAASGNVSYLLPQAFAEGSPLHPSYGAGHATVAGAAVTILKALFQEDWVIPNPVMPNPADGGQTDRKSVV